MSKAAKILVLFILIDEFPKGRGASHALWDSQTLERAYSEERKVSMQWTEIQTGQTHRAFARLMGSFGDRADTVVAELNDDNDTLASRVAVLCFNNGFEPSTSQVRVREIMGKNCFGIEEAIKHFDIAPTKRQLAYMADVPYSETTLIACKDTHILAAVFRFSGVEIREKVKSKKVFCQQDDWYDTHPFSSDKGYVEWHLVRKTPVDDSTGKTWDEQQSLLGDNEETPKFQVLIYAVVGHFLATGEKLFENENMYVRCSDFDSDGDRVFLRFCSGGLDVGSDDAARRDVLAASSSRKQES